MFLRLRAVINKELHYLQGLSADQRQLLLSSALFGLAQPMITVFSNTYLWRQSHSPVTLAVFGIGQYAGLCFGFLLNGFGLQRFRPTTLFLAGCLLQGVVPVLLVSAGVNAAIFAPLFGFALGSAGGFYWGNRNLLTSALTNSVQRFKYISLESTFGLASSVLAPVLIGWFLVFGEHTGLYAAQSAYEVTAVVGFFLLAVAGWCVSRIHHAFEPLKKLFIEKRSSRWQKMRLLDYVNGFTDGFERVIPLVILLLFLGKEDSVGTVQSVAAILSMLGMYIAGKKVKHKDHARIVGMWTLVTGAGKTVFAVLFSTIGALIFHGLNALVVSFRWASLAAVMYETIDGEPGAGLAKRYRYLMDREFALNAGRVSGLFVFIGLFTVSAAFTMRYGLLLSILFQCVMILLVKIVSRAVPHEDGVVSASTGDE
ncbi:MAG: hypothetical protein WC802_00500 [Patescibacteria group bacterium]|jgi:YQGE family putative transporter